MSVNEYTRQKMIIIIICFNLQYTRYFRQSAINVGQSHSLSVIESVKMLVLGIQYPVQSVFIMSANFQVGRWATEGFKLTASVKKIPFHKHSIIMRRAVNYSNQLRNVCCIAWVHILLHINLLIFVGNPKAELQDCWGKKESIVSKK